MAETKKPLVFRDRDTKEKIPFYVKTEDVELPDGTDIGTKVAELEEAIGNAGEGTVTGIKVGSNTYEPTEGVVDISGAVPTSTSDLNNNSDFTTKAYVDAAVQALQTALNNLMNGQNVTDVIDTFNEVVAFLNGIDTDDPTLFNQLKSLSDAISALQTALAGKQDALTFDDVPTAGSNKPVKSGGVKSYVDNKMQNVIINEISGLSGSIGISNTDGTTYIMFGSSSSVENTATPSISHSNPDSNGTTVTITNNDDDTNAAIYYTTDGTTPTSGSTLYSAPFTVNSAVTVKAIAYAEGKLPSSVATHAIDGSAQPTLSISNTATSSTITATGASGSTVYISTDGETWTSGTGTASITVQKTAAAQSVTVYAYATETGKLPSAQVSQTYNISEAVSTTLEGTCQNAAPFNVTIGSTQYPVTPTGDSAPYSWSVELENVTSLQNGDGSTNNIFGNASDTNILSITAIPSSVTEIGVRAFANMSALTSFTTGGCAAAIKSRAFINDSALANMTITDTCTIASGATYIFQACPLTNLYIGSGITNIPTGIFGNTLIKTLEIKSKNIGSQAFKGCKGLLSLTLHEGVETIGDYAFSMVSSGTYMSGLDLVIPSTCKEIKQDAFEYCKNFASVEIKRYDATDNDYPITKLSLNAGTTSTGELGLSKTASFPIYVPDAALSTYQADQYWSVYSTRVKSINNKPS